MNRKLASSLLASALYLWAAPSVVAAQAPDPAEPATPPDPTPTTGRGFSWGAHAVLPLFLGEVHYVGAADDAPYYNPGAGVLGRVGIELPYGLSLYGIFSLQAFSVEGQKALLLYRGALELRWTIDTGTFVLPIVSAGGSALFYVRDGAMGATGGVHGSGGVAFAIAWWAQFEVMVELDVAFPGEAFTDVVLALVPSVGGSFFF